MPTVTVEHLLERTLACFSPSKQEQIQLYVDCMIDQHISDSGHREPGTYGFQDALSYCEATNSPSMDLVAEIIGSSDKEKLRSIGFLWQAVDDTFDWIKDAQDNVMNLWIATSTDAWKARENPANEEFDHLKRLLDAPPGKRLARTFRNKLRGIKSPQMRLTQSLYHQEINKHASLVGGKALQTVMCIL